MRKRLTDRFVQTVKPPAAGRAVYSDSEAPGLELRVSSHSVKSWSVRYRLKGGERERATPGTYPAITLANARARALEIAAAAARGIDLPAEEKRAREEEHKDSERPQTVAELIDRYVAEYARTNQRRWRMIERMLGMHVVPTLGKKPLTELRRSDLVELLDDLQNKKGLHAQVNRCRSQVVAMCNWAIAHEWLDVNPVAMVKRRKIETSRERVLSDEELRRIWRVTDTLSSASSSFVKTLILTGQRRDEVRLMPWSEIDLDQALWVLPAARNKSKRDHEIPLSPAVLVLLGDRPRSGGPVFTLDGRRSYAGTPGLKRILDRKSGVTDWVFHDFRRTAASGMAALHITQDVIDRTLNHARPKLAATYNKHAYLAEKRRALEAWADRVGIITGDGRDAPNVVALGAGA